MRKYTTIVATLLIILFGILYYSQETNISYIVNTGAFNSYVPTQFIMPDVNITDTVELRWTGNDTSKAYGDSADICLIAFNQSNQPIKIDPSAQKCGYGPYGEYQSIDHAILLGKTSVSSGYFDLKVDSDWQTMFENKPERFKIGIYAVDSLPTEGRSEWAGLISSMISNSFLIKF